MDQGRAELASGIYQHVTVFLRDPAKSGTGTGDRALGEGGGSYSLRDSAKKGTGTARLQLAFEALETNWEAWSARRDLQKLTAALESDATFLNDLAAALKLTPQGEIPALIQKAIHAVDVGRDKELKEISRDPDWYSWLKSRDERKFRDLLLDNPEIRDAVARVLNHRLEADRAGEVALAAADRLESGQDVDSLRAVFLENTLNWERFKRGGCETLFQDRLRDDFQFRQAVAAATNYVSAEATGLAQLFVRMLAAMKPAARAASIHAIRKHFDEGSILDRARKEEVHPKDWEIITENAALEFSLRPGTASKVWETLKWPRPFPLVLREEQRQIEWRRRKAEAASLASALIAELDALPPARPESASGIVSSTNRIEAFFTDRRPHQYKKLQRALRKYTNGEEENNPA